jgi:hypothetical protein
LSIFATINQAITQECMMPSPLTEQQIQGMLADMQLGRHGRSSSGQEIFLCDHVILGRKHQPTDADPGTYTLSGMVKGQKERIRLEKLLRKQFANVSNIEVKASIPPIVIKN